MKNIYITRFVAGDKNEQKRVAKFEHLPEFSYVYFTCSDCGKKDYSCMDWDADIYKAHFGNREGKPICFMCWQKILQEERERVFAMFRDLPVSDYTSIWNGRYRVYFRKTKKLIMVSNNQYNWRRCKISTAIELWRKYEAA